MLINDRIGSTPSVSIAASSTHELYKRRALTIQLSSPVSLLDGVDNRSRNVSDYFITNKIHFLTYQSCYHLMFYPTFEKNCMRPLSETPSKQFKIENLILQASGIRVFFSHLPQEN